MLCLKFVLIPLSQKKKKKVKVLSTCYFSKVIKGTIYFGKLSNTGYWCIKGGASLPWDIYSKGIKIW